MSSMRRLERKFAVEDIKKIRMNCQYGYGMEEKLALVKEVMTGAASIEEFAHSEKAKAAQCFWAAGTDAVKKEPYASTQPFLHSIFWLRHTLRCAIIGSRHTV